MTTKHTAEVWAWKLNEVEGVSVEVAQMEAYRIEPTSPLGWGIRTVVSNPYWCGPLYTNLEDLPSPWAMMLMSD